MSNLITKEFDVFAFRAIDEPELCQQYLAGHRKVLTDYGIENVTSSKPTWIENPNIYCLGLKEKPNDKLIGGIRIQIADGIHSLPVEDAIGYIDNKIYQKVDYLATNGGTGELSGLWVSNLLKGLGFGTYLVRASIASSIQLNFKTMIGICAQYSLQMFQNVGFIIDETMGINGSFSYPNNNYIAHVVGILNAINLEHSSPIDKMIMTELRNNLVTKRKEVYNENAVTINYNLKYPYIKPVSYKRKISEIY